MNAKLPKLFLGLDKIEFKFYHQRVRFPFYGEYFRNLTEKPRMEKELFLIVFFANQFPACAQKMRMTISPPCGRASLATRPPFRLVYRHAMRKNFFNNNSPPAL
jgi:hypothetical protein